MLPPFSIGLGLAGIFFLLFPSLRVAGLLALLLAAAYPILMWLLGAKHRR